MGRVTCWTRLKKQKPDPKTPTNTTQGLISSVCVQVFSRTPTPQLLAHDFHAIDALGVCFPPTRARPRILHAHARIFVGAITTPETDVSFFGRTHQGLIMTHERPYYYYFLRRDKGAGVTRQRRGELCYYYYYSWEATQQNPPQGGRRRAAGSRQEEGRGKRDFLFFF